MSGPVLFGPPCIRHRRWAVMRYASSVMPRILIDSSKNVGIAALQFPEEMRRRLRQLAQLAVTNSRIINAERMPYRTRANYRLLSAVVKR